MNKIKTAILLAAVIGSSIIATSADARGGGRHHHHHHHRSGVGFFFAAPLFYYPGYAYYRALLLSARCRRPGGASGVYRTVRTRCGVRAVAKLECLLVLLPRQPDLLPVRPELRVAVAAGRAELRAAFLRSQ